MCVACKVLLAFASVEALGTNIWADTLQEQHILWSYPAHQQSKPRAGTLVEAEAK